MDARVHTIDEYLSTLDGHKRAALQTLRKTIHAAAPGAEECISYGVPTLRLDGRVLVSFGAGKEHCALYPGPTPIETLHAELARFRTSRGTIRFTPDSPLPAALVRRIVKLRMGEIRRET